MLYYGMLAIYIDPISNLYYYKFNMHPLNEHYSLLRMRRKML